MCVPNVNEGPKRGPLIRIRDPSVGTNANEGLSVSPSSE